MVAVKLVAPPAAKELLDTAITPDWKLLPVPLPISYVGLVEPPLPLPLPLLLLPPLLLLLLPEVRLPLPLSPPQAVRVSATMPAAMMDANVRIVLLSDS